MSIADEKWKFYEVVNYKEFSFNNFKNETFKDHMTVQLDSNNVDTHVNIKNWLRNIIEGNISNSKQFPWLECVKIFLSNKEVIDIHNRRIQVKYVCYVINVQIVNTQ